MTENLKLEPWGNHNYKGSKPKTENEIKAFENGEHINCSEIPNYCKEFPDTCMCRTIRFAKKNDVKGSQMLFEPEKTGYSGSKPWLLEELKGFEKLVDFTPSIKAKNVEVVKNKIKKKGKYKEPDSFKKLNKADRDAASRVRATNKWTSHYDLGGYEGG